MARNVSLWRTVQFIELRSCGKPGSKGLLLTEYSDYKVAPATCCRPGRSTWGLDMGMNRHRHAWREDDICASCGAQRCHATQLRSAIMLQSARCRRATQEGSQFCRRHRYLDHVRGRKMVETLELQPEAKAS